MNVLSALDIIRKDKSHIIYNGANEHVEEDFIMKEEEEERRKVEENMKYDEKKHGETNNKILVFLLYLLGTSVS